MEDLGIKISTSLGDSIRNMETASNGFKKLTNSTNGTHSSFAKFNTIVSKSNNKFTNLNKDLNRSSQSFGTLANRLTKLTSIFNIGTLASYGFGASLANSVQSALDMIETTNLFNVALGDTADATKETTMQMSELLGLDLTNLENSIGTYALLSRSMGMTTEQASILSVNMAQLATDYASLTNVPVAQAMADLKSGLVGQSETVYKYGLDVTEAGIKSEALAEGITKSVRNMTQGEKMALRYNAMLRQSSLTQGDFARTINTPANQLKILSERFTTLGRTIGTIFIPMLEFALPYLNAIVLVMTNIAKSIATLFGYTEDTTGGNMSSGLDSITDSSEDASDAIDGATSSVEKLKRATMGFDQLNIINEPTSKSGSSSGSDVSILPSINLASYDNMMNRVRQISKDLASSMQDTLEKIAKYAKPTTDALKNLYDNGFKNLEKFSVSAVLSLYNDFFVPLGKWTLGKGLPRLFNILNLFLTSIDLDKLSKEFSDLMKALEPFSETIGEGILDFYEYALVPIASIAFNSIVIPYLDNLAYGIEILNNICKEATPVLREFYEGFLVPLGKFVGDIINKFLTSFRENVEKLQKELDGSEAFADLLNILEHLEPAFKACLDIASTWYSKMIEIANGTVFIIIKERLKDIFDILGLISAIMDGDLKDAWEHLKDLWLDNKLDTINSLTSGLKNRVIELKDAWIEMNRFVVNRVVQFIIELPNTWNNLQGYYYEMVNNFSSRVIDFSIQISTTVGDIRDFVNNIIDTINDAVVSKLNFSIDAPFWLGGGSYDFGVPYIPRLAKGGIVDSGTIFQAGEAGTEAIVPLENNTEWIQRVAMEINDNNSSLSYSDIKKAFKDALRESDLGDTVLYVGSEPLARAVNKGNKLIDRRYNLVLE